MPANLLMGRDTPIAKRLKQARERAGISQRQLGLTAKIDIQSASPRINQYERGKREPDYRTVEKLAEVLRCPVAYFFVEEDDVAEIIWLLHRLSAKRRRQLLAMLSKEVGEPNR